MPNAYETLKQNDIESSLELLKGEIREAPSDPAKRVFLFQLNSVIGEWEKSLTQLNVARDLDPSNKEMAETYQEVLRCEGLRSAVFAGERSPMILGEPSEWIAKLLQALKYFAQSDFQAFQALQEEAFDLADTFAGHIYESSAQPDESDEQHEEGVPFQWLADADMRIGPVLEAIVNGRYYWVPFENIQTIEIEAPVDLRDLVWIPANFQWRNQGQAVGFIPTRYPGSTDEPENEIRLAQSTKWDAPVEGLYAGKGLRILATDAGEFPLTKIRRIVFEN